MNTSVYTPCDELKTNILEKAGAEQVRGYPLIMLAYEGGGRPGWTGCLLLTGSGSGT